MVADRQPCHTLVPLDGAQDFILGHVEVALSTSGLEGNHEQTKFEDDLIPTMLSHDHYEGFVVSSFRDDNNDGPPAMK
jgi:hypothetical protein